LVLEVVPALIAAAAAVALLFNQRSARTLLLLFAVTLGQAAAVSLAVPEIEGRYQRTVREAETSWTAPQQSVAPAPLDKHST